MRRGGRRPRVAIVGLGLIGGSLARALTRAGYRVLGHDRPAVLRRARAARALSESGTLQDAAAADLVILAAPPRANLALLRRLARLPRRPSAITDVSSVKAPICREAARLRLREFVGGHPVAGSERTGFAASRADLFRGRAWVLTPGAGSSRAAALVEPVIRAAGARPLRMRPAEHDRAMAVLSHLPQLVAWALLETARRDRVAARHLRAAGPGFRDMTRLARSPRPLWREILAQNGHEVARALAAFQRALSSPEPRKG